MDEQLTIIRATISSTTYWAVECEDMVVDIGQVHAKLPKQELFRREAVEKAGLCERRRTLCVFRTF